MRYQKDNVVLDFGPMGLTVQKTMLYGTISFDCFYSETEREQLIAWLFEFARLTEDSADQFPACIFKQVDAEWHVWTDTLDEFSLTGESELDSRDLTINISQEEARNLAYSLNQGLAFTPDEYQRLTKTTAMYYETELPALVYTALGLAGEAGEIINKVKKIYRDDEGMLTDETEQDLKKEAGDCLWYLARMLDDMGISFEDVMRENLLKLQSRQMRGTLFGQGDYR